MGESRNELTYSIAKSREHHLLMMEWIDRTSEILVGTVAEGKDRIFGILIAVLFIGLCVAMWIKPDILGLDGSDFTGRRGRVIATVIDLAWSRPVGAILGLVAVLMIYGSVTKPGPRKPNP